MPRALHKRARRALLLASGLLVLGPGCGGKPRSPGRVSSGRDASDAGPGSSGSGAAAAMLSPRPDGGPILPAADEELTLPYGGPELTRRIELAAGPGVLDVQLSIDTTSSIAGEIDQLQSTLEDKVVPELHRRVADVSFGVSRFADFPARPFGFAGNLEAPADQPFVLLTPVTSDMAAVASAVARLDQPLAEGGDIPEAGAEALFQIASGEGYENRGDQLIAAFDHRARVGGGTLGGVGFRDGALRVVLHVTDAPSHAPEDYGTAFPGTHSLIDAAAALKKIDAKLIAIVSGACGKNKDGCDDADLHAQARSQLEAVAIATGALGAKPSDGSCPYGVAGTAIASRDGVCPLVFDVDSEGQGLADAAVDAIAGLVDGIRFGAVSGSASEDPIGFVKGVVPIAEKDSASDGGVQATADLLPANKPDGKLDSFVDVHARQTVAFELELKNDRLRATDVDQVFRAQIEIKGDDVVLVRRTLRIRVPKGDSLAPLEGEPDAGR